MNRRLTAILLFLMQILTLSAQETMSDQAIMEQALENYDIGRLQQARDLLVTNLSQFKGQSRESSLRLLALCSLGLDDQESAQRYVELLLTDNPYFTTSMRDPQRFVDMIEEMKSGMSATITTASSKAENLNEVPVPTTLITEDMIHDSGARNLQELLVIYVPGMNIIDCNDDINISMRGIYSNGQEKILIMLNGHRLNSYCTNTASPDFSISLEKIKQIEVLRGPASSLYGGVALTAVVNIITKQGADIDGVKLHAGIGTYGQLRGDMLLGKRYFDLDMLIWGSFYKSNGQSFFINKENTGLGLKEGNVTVGGIGNRPTYDIGVSLKYKHLSFLYNTQYSQVQSPMTMTHLFAPYDIEKYKTFYGIRPSHATRSHHADLSYSRSFGKVFLKGSILYDNSDLTHYQVISDDYIEGFSAMLPLPPLSLQMLGNHGGLSRYISGQEHTFGIKLQGDWEYIKSDSHRGQLTFGAEFSRFQLDDTRYVFGYNFKSTLPETVNVSDLGKGHEPSANASLQLKHQWKSFILNAGLRFDYKDRYDELKIKEFSPRVALIYVQPKWNVKLSYAKSFIDAPYLYRKTNRFLAEFTNMPDLTESLSPELLHSFQLTFGTTQLTKGLNMELNAFYNKAKDLIYMDIIEHFNTGKSTIYGLEFSGRYEYRHFSANLSATWQKANEFQLFSLNRDMPFNTPEFSANAVLAWSPLPQLNLHSRIGVFSRQQTFYRNIVNYGRSLQLLSNAADLLYQWAGKDIPEDVQAQIKEMLDQSTEYGNNSYTFKDIPAYFLVDLGASYKIGRWEFGANVHNLLNKKYSLSGMSTGLIPQRGRWLLFDVSFNF